MKNFDFLDSYRGLAAIVVIFGHMFYYFLKQQIFTGLTGILLFFQLSAFLLTYRLIIQYDAAGLNGTRIAQVTINYFLMRFFRIYVTFCIFCMLYTLCLYSFYGESVSSIMLDAAKLNRVRISRDGHRYAHLWTIAVEIYYYMFIPPIAFAMSRLKSLWHSLIMMALAVVYMLWLMSPSVSKVGFSIRTDSSYFFPIFFLGSLNAYLYTAATQHGLVGLVKRYRVLNFVTFCLSGGLFYAVLRIYFSYSVVHLRLYAILVFIQFLIMMIGAPNAFTEWLADSKFLKQYGKFSFGAYLFHMLAMRIVSDKKSMLSILNQQEDLAVYTILLSLVFGVVFHYVIEVPMIRMANYFMWRVKKPSQASSLSQNLSQAL